MGLFYLTTVYCSIRALEGGSGPRGAWVGAAVLACALGIATKEVMVTAPLIVMLWDRQFASNGTASRKPLYLGLVSTWAVLAALFAGGPRAASVGFSFEGWPWWRYLMTQTAVVAHYLRLAVVPSPLVLDYEWPAAALGTEVALPALVVASLVGATTFGLVRRSSAAFLGAWFFLILAPASSVVPIVTEAAAEHHMYLPLAGIIALTVLGGFRVLGVFQVLVPKSTSETP